MEQEPLNQTHHRKQLYYLLKELKNSIDDHENLGSLVGYLILDGLYALNALSESEEETHRLEMMSIYDCISSTLDSLIEKVTGDRNEEKGYTTLCEKIACVDPLLKDDLKQGDPKRQSELLNTILKNLPAKGYEDRIRRRGLSLLERVARRGYLKDALNGDYDDIYDCFVRGGP